MTAHDTGSDLRRGLIDSLRAAGSTERDVFAAVDPMDRDAPAPDGGWSPKDVRAHLSAWRRRQIERLAAVREQRDEPALAATETDEINAIFHAERADWSWGEVTTDAGASMTGLIVEVEAAADSTLEDGRVSGAIMGNGAEHALAHLAAIADGVGLGTRVAELATEIETIVDAGTWPSRPAAFARYNLACFHALGGRLDHARALLRLALPAEEELRVLAPEDDDLIALRDEIPSLAEG